MKDTLSCRHDHALPDAYTHTHIYYIHSLDRGSQRGTLCMCLVVFLFSALPSVSMEKCAVTERERDTQYIIRLAFDPVYHSN